MVMRLPPPVIDSVDLVANLVSDRQNGRNRDFFNGIADAWRARVEQYLAARAYPPDIPKWPEIADNADAFRNLYLSPKEHQAQYEVLRTLRRHKLNHCPACGEPGKPNTLDHYLPKADYPHFSVEPHNLFPMCDACQGLKGTNVGDDQHPRYFLHPYFDDFLDQQVLRLIFIQPYATPIPKLQAHPDLAPDRATLVEKHIQELGLHQRYGHFFEEEHMRLVKGAADMRANGLDVRQGIAVFEAMARASGANTWNSLFYAGVRSDEGLLDWLSDEPLPDFVAS